MGIFIESLYYINVCPLTVVLGLDQLYRPSALLGPVQLTSTQYDCLGDNTGFI